MCLFYAFSNFNTGSSAIKPWPPFFSCTSNLTMVKYGVPPPLTAIIWKNCYYDENDLSTCWYYLHPRI